MKLSIRMMEATGIPATGVGLVLCDESGVRLPNQTKVTLTTGVDGAPRAIVEFVIDGESIELVKSR